MRAVSLLAGLAATALLAACATPPPAAPGENLSRVSDGDVHTGSRIAVKKGGSRSGVKSIDGRAAAEQMRGSMESQPQSK